MLFLFSGIMSRSVLLIIASVLFAPSHIMISYKNVKWYLQIWGLAQSLFQVGGNLGGSLGPLLVALIVAPYGRHNIALFAILSVIAIMVMIPVGKWYKRYITRMKRDHIALQPHMQMPLPMEKTVLSISILLILIFSKYIYMASLSSYYTFYLIDKFGVSVQDSQLYLFVFLVATAIGTLMGGPIGDRIGRK